MSNRQITGLVTATRRAGTSANGNPSYDVTILDIATGESATYRTSSDVMLAYGITNAEYRHEAHVFGLTRAGRLDGTAAPVEGWHVRSTAGPYDIEIYPESIAGHGLTGRWEWALVHRSEHRPRARYGTAKNRDHAVLAVGLALSEGF